MVRSSRKKPASGGTAPGRAASGRACAGQSAEAPPGRDPRPRVYIALGSNLGDRERQIHAALCHLEEQGDVRVVGCSSLHQTEPVGGPPGQGRYLNAVAQLETGLPPRELLQRLLAIERRQGRERGVVNGPRTLDLDLLLYGERFIDEPELTVPHPRMWERPFVMQPLAEICDVRVLEAWWKQKRSVPRP